MLKEWAADKHQEGLRFSLSVKVKECMKNGWQRRENDCTDYVDSWLAVDKGSSDVLMQYISQNLLFRFFGLQFVLNQC